MLFKIATKLGSKAHGNSLGKNTDFSDWHRLFIIFGMENLDVCRWWRFLFRHGFNRLAQIVIKIIRDLYVIAFESTLKTNTNFTDWHRLYLIIWIKNDDVILPKITALDTDYYIKMSENQWICG